MIDPLLRLLPIGIVALVGLSGATLAQGSTPTTLDLGGRFRRPFTFVENRGQWDRSARFLASQRGALVGVEPGAIAIVLRRAKEDEEGPEGVHLRLVFENASLEARWTGEGRREGANHFFLGSDPARWRTDVPGFASVVCRNVYPGIDLQVREHEGRLEYDLLLAPGAAIGDAVVRVEGAEGLRIEGESLVLDTAIGEVKQGGPIAWRGTLSTAGEVISCRYRLLDGNRFGFVPGGLGPDERAVIDPGLDWSTYLGGSSYEFVFAATASPAGKVTVAGETAASNFPTTPGAYDPTYNGGPAPTADVFVTQFDAGTGAVVYSTYLGGSSGDKPFSIEGDGSGGVIVAGNASSSDFPATPGAYDTSMAGQSDGFVTRLNAAGSALVYSTFLGGGSGDIAQAVAADAGGEATVSGVASSSDFPVTAGAFDTTSAGSSDAFVARLNASGTALVFSTFLGGSNGDVAQAVGIDDTGAALVSGVTSSSDFPVTGGAFDPSSSGPSDAFVTRLNAAGSALLYSTYLGGSSGDVAEDLAADASGVVTVVGVTSSNDFPTTPGSVQSASSGSSDAFVSRLDAAGGSLLFSTLLGGGAGDVGRAVKLHAFGGAVVAGDTSSSNFPVTAGAFDPTSGGAADAFVAFVNSGGSALLYSTYLGGGGGDGAHALALLSSAAVVAAGVTNSNDFPTTPGAFDPTITGNGDGYVTRLGAPLCGASPYGASTPACAGAIEIGTNGCPTSGNAAFAFTASSAPPSTIGLLVVGLAQSPAGLPVFGISVHVSLAAPFFTLGGMTSASGGAVLPLPIPPGSSGAQVFTQFVWVNTPSCPGTGFLSASGALAITVQ